MMVTKAEIKYELEMLENMSALDIEKDHMDTVNIWISGSGCSATTDGFFRYILQYREFKKFEEQMISGATANQAFINGAIHAIKRITKPGRISIIVPTALGFEKAFEGKGVNADLFSILYDEIAKRNCELTEVRFINGAEIIKEYIATNSGKKHIIAENEKRVLEKEDRKYQYKMMIYKECLGKVYDTLKNEGIKKEILDIIKEIRP